MLNPIKSLFYVQGSGVSLGYLRILFFSCFFLIVAQVDFPHFGLAESLLWKSPWHIDFLISQLPSPETIWWMHRAWLVFLLFSALGFLGRISMAMSFILGYFIFGLPVGFLESNFQYFLPTLALGVFAFSNAHDFVSIDSLYRKKNVIISTEYGWPQQLILFCVVMMYFGAASGKLRHSGLNWVFEKTFQFHLQTAHINFKPNIPQEAFFIYDWLMNQPILLTFVGFYILTLQILSPLAFLFKKFLILFLPQWVLFHIMVALMMGINVSFWYVPVLFVLIEIILSQRKLNGQNIY